MIFDVLGLVMFMWYGALRWIFCASEKWIYTPINLITALVSIIFLTPSVFITDKVFNIFFYCICMFLWFRNSVYTVEDIIDLKHFPTSKQLFYVMLDIIMVIYLTIWIIKYYRN